MPSLCPMNMEHPRVATSHVEENKKVVHHEVVAEALKELARQEVQEPVDPVFEAAVTKGIELALVNIRRRFQDTGDPDLEAAKAPDANLEFHNEIHTQEVKERTRKILEAMGVSERRVRLGELLAAYHDTIQGFQEKKRERDGAMMRDRFISKNEEASAEELITYMKSYPKAFDDEEIGMVLSGIQHTVPDWDIPNKTVKQPNFLDSIKEARGQQLNSNSPELVKRALALADLGTAGMDGPEKYIPEGNKIFREENLDFPRLLNDHTQRAFLTKRMLDWSQAQVDFAKGRQKLLDDELKGLEPQMTERVRGLFSQFDDSIKAAQVQLEERQEMEKMEMFEQLAKSFGYTSPKYTIH